LCEHLVLSSSFGQVDHAVNGSVGPSLTQFTASGGIDDVSRLLGSLHTHLSCMPIDRLDLERGILRTEAAGRGAGIAEELLFWQFGARGFGLLIHREFGLEWLGPDELGAWSERWFVAENAALWVAGPDPSKVRIDLGLRAGTRADGPPVEDGPDILPAWAQSRSNGVHLGLLGERDPALAAAADTLGARVRGRLRMTEGVSYAAGGNYERLTREVAHVLVGVDCLPEHAVQATNGMIAEIAAFAEKGPTGEEVDSFRRQVLSAKEHAYASLGAAVGAARDHAFGQPIDEAAIDARVESLEPVDVQDAFVQALDRSVLLVPRNVTVNDARYTRAPTYSTDVVDGRSLRPDRTVPPSRDRDRLIVADNGLSLVDANGRALTVRFEHCVCLARWSDGVQELYGLDGFRLRFVPDDWMDSAAAVAAIEAGVARDVVVPITGTSPHRPADPAAVEAERKRGARLRRRAMFKVLAKQTGKLVLLLAVIGAVLVAAIASGSAVPILAASAAGIVGAKYRDRRTRSRRQSRP
jgi:hypothetical protein